jgi:hypothetical protein
LAVYGAGHEVRPSYSVVKTRPFSSVTVALPGLDARTSAHRVRVSNAATLCRVHGNQTRMIPESSIQTILSIEATVESPPTPSRSA